MQFATISGALIRVFLAGADGSYLRIRWVDPPRVPLELVSLNVSLLITDECYNLPIIITNCSVSNFRYP